MSRLQRERKKYAALLEQVSGGADASSIIESLMAQVAKLEQERSTLTEALNECVSVHDVQVHMIRKLEEKNGPLQIIVDPNISTNQVLVLASEAETMQMQAFDDGSRYTFEALKEPQWALGRVTEALQALHTSAMCDNGARTRKTMSNGLGRLLTAVKDMNIAFERSSNENALITLSLDSQVVAAFHDYANHLEVLIHEYLVNETHIAMDIVSSFIARHDEALAPLYEEVRQIKQRGQRIDELYTFVGKLAADQPEPERGKAWLIGKTIYDEMCLIPSRIRSAEQQAVIDHWHNQGWMSISGREVLDKAKLGTYISRARKAHFERQQTSLTQSSSRLSELKM